MSKALSVAEQPRKVRHRLGLTAKWGYSPLSASHRREIIVKDERMQRIFS
jgi:hypothetical protein